MALLRRGLLPLRLLAPRPLALTRSASSAVSPPPPPPGGPPADVTALLGPPSWSVRSLVAPPVDAGAPPVLSVAELQHIARLACLTVDDAEVGRMQADVGAFLRFISAVEAVDTAGVEPMSSPLESTHLLALWEDAPPGPTGAPETAAAGGAAPPGVLLSAARAARPPFFVAPRALPPGPDAAAACEPAVG